MKIIISILVFQMTTLTKEDLLSDFEALTTLSFKRKVYETCVLYAMKSFDNLDDCFGDSPFKDEKYYTIEEIIDGIVQM